MAKDVNLKLRWLSDTSGIENGSRRAKAAVKDFDKTVNQSISSISDAFGVSAGKVDALMSSVQGLGVKMQNSSREGVAAFGKLISSISATSAAIAGLGIGAAIASFKALNETAEAFKKTVAGANIEMATAAYVSTYQQVFYDMNTAQGKAFANFMANLKKVKAGAGAVIGSALVTAPTQWDTALLGLASPTLWKNTIQGMKAANAAGERAEEIANEIYDLQRKRSDQTVHIANLENEISKQMNIFRDKSKSAEERTRARAEAEQLIRQKYTEQYDIESAIADLMEEQNSLSASSPEQIDAANQQRVKANGLVSQMNAELRTFLRYQTSSTGAVKETTAALSAEAKAMLAVANAQIQQSIDKRPELYTLSSPGLPTPGATTTQNTALAGGTPWKEQTKVVVDLNNALKDLGTSSAEAIGELVGNLINGENAWASFGNAAAGAIADMAISVGKAIMQEGIAIEAAKMAMTTLSGIGAIGAGAALIAIGTALKTSLSNAARGNYSASASVASSSYGSGASMSREYSSRELNVKVTGTLAASGSQLVAVLNNEQTRKSHTS